MKYPAFVNFTFEFNKINYNLIVKINYELILI